MTWQSFKQARLIRFWSPVPAVIAAGILYLLFWHHRHLLGGDRRIHPLGWSAAAAAGRPQRTVGLLPADTSRRVAADPHRWQDDHRHVRRLPAAALWANNVKLRLPRSRIRIAQAVVGGIIAGFGARLAMGCNRRPSSPAFRSSPCTPGCLPSPPPSALVWRPLHAAAPFSHPGKNTKGIHRLAVNPKPQQARRRFRRGWWSFRHDRLGPAHRRRPPGARPGDAVWHCLWPAY